MEQKHGKLWLRVSTRQACPICHKTHWCMLAASSDTVICMRVPSDNPTPEGKGLGGWFHQLGAERWERLSQAALESFVGEAHQLAEPGLRHRVNHFLLDHQPLQPEHRQQLEVRGLSSEAIAARGYGTWDFPDRRMRSQLARAAYESFGAAVLDVPGFCVRDQSNKEYVTLTGGRGLLIPVRDVEGRLSGFTIKGEGLAPKYYPLSRNKYGGASLGIPVHVARPRGTVISSLVVWVTEGPLKADIASEYLNAIVVAVPGVSALKELLPTLLELRKRGELAQLVVALDEDQNKHVEEAKRKIAELAARNGIPVSLASWSSEHKGLDDLLKAGGTPQLTPYRVSGNGKRTLEEVPSLPRPAIAPMSLDEVRKLQATAIREFLLKPKIKSEPDEVLLIRTQPGVGKSTVITEAVNDAFKKQKNRGAVFVCRHDLAMQPGREKWPAIQGRTHIDKDHPEPPCGFAHLQKDLARLGLPAQSGCDHCPLLASCQKNTEPGQGPYYHGQFQKSYLAPATVYQAQHLLVPSLWEDTAAHVVIDDVNLDDLRLEELKLLAAEVGHALRWAEEHPEHSYALAVPLLRALHQILRTDPYGKSFHWDGKKLFERLEHIAEQPVEEMLEQAALAEEPDAFGDRQIDAPLSTPKRFLKALVEVLRFEWEAYRAGQSWNRRVRVERKDADKEHYLLLTLRRDLPYKALKGKPIIILDASTTKGQIQRLFPDRKIIEVDPTVAMSLAVTIHQNPTLGYGKRQLSDSKKRDQALDEIGSVLAKHLEQKKVGLITHKPFERLVKNRFPEIKTAHFYGQRGSNELADCDALMVLGTPNPNPEDLERQAEALYWDETPINHQTVLEDRAFETRGPKTLKTSVRNYVDPRLQELLYSKREQELIQSVFRVRPLSVAEVPKAKQMELGLYESGNPAVRERADIYLWTNIALPGICVALMLGLMADDDSKKLEEAVRRLWRQGQRITEQKLALVAQVQRANVRRWRLAPNGRWTEAARPGTKIPSR